MFLLRIIVFIAIFIITLPYIKKGADAFFKRLPSELSTPIKKTLEETNKITKEIKEIKK
jgi:hypothetical protein